MNVEEIVQKAKELIREGNIEKATQFIEEHKNDLGEQYDKVKELIANFEPNDVVDKIKDLFKK